MDTNVAYNNFRALDKEDRDLIKHDHRCFIFSEKVAEVYRRDFLDEEIKIEIKMLHQLYHDFHKHIIGVDVLDVKGICGDESKGLYGDEMTLSSYLKRNKKSFQSFSNRNQESLMNPNGRYFVFLMSQDLGKKKGGHWIACIFDIEKAKIYVNDSMLNGNAQIYKQIFMHLFEFLDMELRIVISGKSIECKLRSFKRQPTGGFQNPDEYDSNGRLIITFQDQHHFCYIEALLYTCEFFLKYLHNETFPPLRSFQKALIVIKRFMSQILHKFGKIRKETILDVFKDDFTIKDVTDGFRYICTNYGPKRINSLDISKSHLSNKSILDIVRDSYAEIHLI